MKVRILLASLLLTASLTYTQEDADSQDPQRLSVKEIAEHAAFWVGQLPKLSQEEYSLLSNYLYLETLSLYYQCVAQRTLISIHTASTLMNKQLAVNEAEAKNIAKKTIKELTELQNELLPARAFLVQANQHCLTAIEQSDYTMLKKIIINYQQYGRAILAQFIKQDKPKIEKILEQTKTVIDSYVKIMGECSDTLDSVVKNENPYVKEGIDKDVTDMDVAMTVTDTALSCLNDTTLICASTKNMSADLLSICATYHRVFFNILYQALQDNDTLDEVYLMFDENGLIDEDDRSEELQILGDKITLHKSHLKS